MHYVLRKLVQGDEAWDYFLKSTQARILHTHAHPTHRWEDANCLIGQVAALSAM